MALELHRLVTLLTLRRLRLKAIVSSIDQHRQCLAHHFAAQSPRSLLYLPKAGFRVRIIPILQAAVHSDCKL